MSAYVTSHELQKTLGALMPKIVDATTKIVDASRKPLLKRIETLEIETKQMATKMRNMTHRGAFKSDTTYHEGNFVSAGGSMFIALKDNPRGTPGNSDDWCLAAKRGRDGDRGRTVRLRNDTSA